MKHDEFRLSYEVLRGRVEECTGTKRVPWNQLTDDQKAAVGDYLLAQDAALDEVIPTVGPDGKPPKQP